MSGDERSIRSARRMVRALTTEYREELGETAELLADELVTNAVRHGGGQFTITASIEDRRLRVTVSDRESSSQVIVNRSGHHRDQGRGLTLVDAMASSWGIERDETEKSVWFEIDLSE
jgi:anti-sigma regulatory factor (Ser/Thr protein kinase)